jgi:hypothetical protein
MNPPKVNKYGFFTENDPIPSDPKKLNARIEKWSKMLENWESFSKSNSKLLKSRIRKGIPSSLRGEVWQLLAKTSSLRKSYPRHHFFRLTNLIDDPDCMVTIEKDLNRTYPTHELFKSSQGQESLRAILRAYAHFDEEIGYCQGMAYIVGVPRMFMDEESSFWMLVAILRNYDMRSLFKDGMEKVYQSYYKANAVLKQFESKIWKKLIGIGFFTQIYATNWFMTVYSSFPVETKMRIWDCFLMEGPKILFRVFVAVFRAHRKLFKNVAFDTCLQVIRGIEKTCDADLLIKAAFSFSLSRKRLREIEREFFYEPRQDLVTWQ